MNFQSNEALATLTESYVNALGMIQFPLSSRGECNHSISFCGTNEKLTSDTQARPTNLCNTRNSRSASSSLGSSFDGNDMNASTKSFTSALKIMMGYMQSLLAIGQQVGALDNDWDDLGLMGLFETISECYDFYFE
ncbi:hypothetical protein RF11_15463 [Thelohanellus kitauei]|uniref:Uncharacterized protein n=1 Tax=Thelohanellus kitauei TaxID=669202 RepID=A0A0C2MCF0_THEKT|nr:hypothetical protein RF11_15463 [Thelohanellus kitauei]